MPTPPGERSRISVLIVLGCFILAVGALAWWLTSDPGRNDLSDAVTIGLGILAVVVPVMQLHVSKSGAGAVASAEQQREALAVAMRTTTAAEKDTLQLSGSDYIQIEWQLDTPALDSDAVMVKRGRVGDVATIGEDWLRHTPA